MPQNKNTKRYWASSTKKYLKTLPDVALLESRKRDSTPNAHELVDAEIKRRKLRGKR